MKNASILVYATQFTLIGGIESHLKEFCKQMSAAGVKIDLLIVNSQMDASSKAFFKSKCRTVLLGKGYTPMTKLAWLFFLSTKILNKNYAALYTNGQGASIPILSKISKWRVWVHHHHTSGDKIDQKSWDNKYKEVLQSATTVIACSSFNVRVMQEALQRPIETIPCFSKQVFVRTRSKIEKIRFGYFGRLIPEKGIDWLGELSNEDALKDVEFNIWGQGALYPPSFFVNYPNIIYHGAFSSKDLPSVLSSIDGFLLISSNSEGLPISLLECMSAGVPWLATDKGGISDIAIDDSSTRVVPASSTYDEVKNSVIMFANDLREGRVDNCGLKKLYSEKYSGDALVSQWSSILGLEQ